MNMEARVWWGNFGVYTTLGSRGIEQIILLAF